MAIQITCDNRECNQIVRGDADKIQHENIEFLNKLMKKIELLCQEIKMGNKHFHGGPCIFKYLNSRNEDVIDNNEGC